MLIYFNIYTDCIKLKNTRSCDKIKCIHVKHAGLSFSYFVKLTIFLERNKIDAYFRHDKELDIMKIFY